MRTSSKDSCVTWNYRKRKYRKLDLGFAQNSFCAKLACVYIDKLRVEPAPDRRHERARFYLERANTLSLHAGNYGDLEKGLVFATPVNHMDTGVLGR